MMRKSLMKANYIKMKLNQEDENRIFIKNKIVKHRWILLLYKNSDKKEERNSKERDSLGITVP